MTLSPGARLGPYEVTASLGAGGMGEVFRARDTRLGRDVAIKVLPASFAADPDRRARFEREAQAVAALSHPNVIAIFDTGFHESSPGSTDAQLFIVMELLAGQTLRERLDAGPLPVRKAVDIAVQIARGLGAAHTKNLVHRDLKPENVFLLDDGQVKILDFGLARQSAASENSGATATAAMTDAGTVLGTVGYMAPEQVRGQAVDARADVFAFGAVLYEMVTGQRAFHRDTAADTMTAILTQDPPELSGSRPDLSPALDRIIRHCLEKNANERFQSARDVAFALEALSGSTISGSSAASTLGAPRPSRTTLMVAVAVACALLLGGAAGYLGRGESAATSAGIAGVSYQPVSFEDGFVFAARFAPDGRTIVYSADWDGQPRGVFVTSLDSLEYQALGFPGADLLGISRTGELAILSGSTLTFGSSYWRLGTLAKASLIGGTPRAELEAVRFADFGADNTMAVVRDDGRRATMEYPVGQVLADTATGFDNFATPRVSPSGEYVAFFDLRVTTAMRVRIYDRAGKFVAESRPLADWWSLAWASPNEVWFAAAEASGSQTAIYGLDLAGQQRTVYRAPGAITLHDISTTGEVLVSFDRSVRREELVESGGTSAQDRSWREGSSPAAIAPNQALLINGDGGSSGPKGSVYFWPAGQSQPVRIANGKGLALSPDAGKALIVSVESPPAISIVPTGAGQAQIVNLGAVESVTWGGWLPDGRLAIQVSRPGTGMATYLLAPNGGNPTALLPAGLTLPSTPGSLISPDGSRIAAVRDTGQWVLCGIADAACRPAPGVENNDVIAGWSADGRSLFVYSPRPDNFQVDRVDLTSGRRAAWKTLNPARPAVSGLRSVAAAPDGTIAYGYSRSASQLYLIRGLK
jgi:eukaryotic-like serine/threonine-protein kinase